MKLLILISTIFLAACGEESVGLTNDGGHCVECYETTNLVGDSAIVCNGQDGGVCF